MKQLDLFNKTHIVPDIVGLKYIPNYIFDIKEDDLIKTIYFQLWLPDLKRRVQHYGYKYDYKAKTANQDLYLGQIPDWLMTLCQKLFDEQIFSIAPNQVISTNTYLAKESAHI